MRVLPLMAGLAMVSCTFDYRALEGTNTAADASLDDGAPPAIDGAQAAEVRDVAVRTDQSTERDVPMTVEVGGTVDQSIALPDTGGAADLATQPDSGSGGTDGALGDGGATGTGGASGTGGRTGAGGASGGGGATATGGRTGSGGAGTGGVTGVGGTSSAGGTTGTGGTIASGGMLGTGGAGTGGAAGAGGSVATEPPSCRGQTFRCGAASESCCTSIHVPGGTFAMGRGAGTDAYSGRANEVPEHDVTVGPFSLDKYEVTVGRMKAFLADLDRWRQAGNPVTNAGANPNLPGVASGWEAGASQYLRNAADLAGVLRCNPGNPADEYTLDTGNDNYPVNCITYYESFAFCIWDGGRLPTEAEWELAAAGGDENRRYPWGPQDPDSTRASFAGCTGCVTTPRVVVGSYPTGVGRWGHLDLAGSVSEYVIDWYQSDWYGAGGATCNNCANVTPQNYRVIRGASWFDAASDIRAAFRGYTVSTTHYQYHGVRCARDP